MRPNVALTQIPFHGPDHHPVGRPGDCPASELEGQRGPTVLTLRVRPAIRSKRGGDPHRVHGAPGVQLTPGESESMIRLDEGEPAHPDDPVWIGLHRHGSSFGEPGERRVNSLGRQAQSHGQCGDEGRLAAQDGAEGMSTYGDFFGREAREKLLDFLHEVGHGQRRPPGQLSIGMLTTTPGRSIVTSPFASAAFTSATDFSSRADCGSFHVTRCRARKGL